MAQGETLAEVTDRLYGLPLEEFTPARDAAAKQLRAAGQRDIAAEIKRLRKPSRLAWALNQVRRHDPDPVDELIGAGERLQEAQRQLVEAGERGLLRDAAAEERELVGRIAELAERELARSGHPANPTAQGKLFSTLHAAAADPEVRDALAAGRLLGEHQLSDLGLVPGGAGASQASGGASRARRGRGAAAEADTRPRDGAERGAQAAAERKARAATERAARQISTKLERARERSHALAKQQKDAERELADAQRAAERAAAAVERAAASAERARATALQAAQQVSELEAQLRQIP
jgi:hypothetical protein